MYNTGLNAGVIRDSAAVIDEIVYLLVDRIIYNWENYLLLLRIVDYSFVPAISSEETVYLKVSGITNTQLKYDRLQFLKYD